MNTIADTLYIGAGFSLPRLLFLVLAAVVLIWFFINLYRASSNTVSLKIAKQRKVKSHISDRECYFISPPRSVVFRDLFKFWAVQMAAALFPVIWAGWLIYYLLYKPEIIVGKYTTWKVCGYSGGTFAAAMTLIYVTVLTNAVFVGGNFILALSKLFYIF